MGRGKKLRIRRWLLLALLFPFFLFITLTVLFYLPPVQDWAVGLATRKLSEATGKKVSVERLRITPLLDVEMEGLLIRQTERLTDSDLQLSFHDRPDRLHPDTLVYAQRCIVDLDMTSLLGGRVAVDAFDLRGTRLDTQDLIDAMVLDGRLERIGFNAHDIELKARRVRLSQARLEHCNLDIALRDTLVTEEDTTTMEIPWRVNFRDISLQDARVTFHGIRDSLSVRADVERLGLGQAMLDLEKNRLCVEDLDARIRQVDYDQNFVPRREGLDPGHIQLTGIRAALPVLEFDMNSGSLHARLKELQARDKSGLTLSHLSADVELDSARISLRDVSLRTPSSRLSAEADMDWDALTPRRRGRMDARISAELAREDVLLLAGGYLPDGLSERYPDKILTAEAEFTGNIDSVTLRSLRLELPEMLALKASGGASGLLDEGGLSASVKWDAETWDVSLLQEALGLEDFRVPALQLSATTRVQDGDYRLEGRLVEAGGRLDVEGHYDTKGEGYAARIETKNLALSDFLPMDSVLRMTASLHVEGHGTDLLSPRSRMHALADVRQMNYGRRDVSNVHLDALMQQGHSFVNFNSANELLDADGCIELQVVGRRISDALFNVDMRGIDLYSLGITKKPLSISMGMHATGHTDLRDSHFLRGSVNSIALQTADSTYYPKDITTELLLERDTLFAFLSAGDLELHMNSSQGFRQVIGDAGRYWQELDRQIRGKSFDRDRLRRLLPDVDLCVESGRQNPLANIAAMMGYSYKTFDIDLHTDTLSGINGHGWVHAVNTGSIVLDTIQFNVRQDQHGMELVSRVCNGRHNPDITFDARLTATLSPHEAAFGLVYYDDRGRKGVDLGAQAVFHNRGIQLHLTPLNPILAYRHFTVNDSNFVAVDSLGRIDANLNLQADDGTGLKVYGMPGGVAEQDLTVSVNRLNLGELCSVLPYMPQITGLLQGDIHVLKTDGIMSVGADMQVSDMAYEGTLMGNVGINAAYLPNEDGSHYVDGFLTQDGQEIVVFSGMYYNKGGQDEIQADVDLQRFPLAMANGFLGETAQLTGYFNGGLHISGSSSAPQVEGQIRTESMHLLSPDYSVDLRVPDESITVSRNRLDLSRLKAYSTGTRPLQLGGYVDFADLSRIRLDVSATATNFELINAPRNRKAQAYGKAFVNMNLLVRGLLSDLSVTGNLNVLGQTDLTYVLKDSPITVEDEMADLVDFVDFSDTVTVAKEEVTPPSNLNMRISVSIDQATQLHCLLSEDGANYANLEGGGNLTLTYDERKGLQLFGRYTILNGRMNYTLMVMTLKDCDIASGSYVDFNGDILNPRLSISASERLNTTITENQTPRSVAFDVGMNITQTLGDMGLEFTLEAPEDLNIQNEIAQMTAQQRGRVAVTLMATGMYVVEGKSSGGFNTTNALNSFLNSQISQITGKALSSVDLSLGVQNTNTASGNITTDYSFRFAKRFWGNRISLIVGGKVSSGAEAENTGLSIIDNVSIEYRLDKSATRYVTLYYDNNYESILEGKVTEMGAGLVLRRKTERLGELFLFRNREEKKKGGER